MGLLYLVLAIIFIIFIWAVVVFNSLVTKRNRVKNAWSDIDVQLKKRYDLVPNLVETVKGYKDYEASVLEKVTQARTSVLKAQKESVASRSEAENMLSSALKTLFAVSENYLLSLEPQKTFKNFSKSWLI
jgi:LemA protein